MSFLLYLSRRVSLPLGHWTCHTTPRLSLANLETFLFQKENASMFLTTEKKMTAVFNSSLFYVWVAIQAAVSMWKFHNQTNEFKNLHELLNSLLQFSPWLASWDLIDQISLQASPRDPPASLISTSPTQGLLACATMPRFFIGLVLQT